ncbi:hypothetical protein PVAP13_1NG146919 [Panicum virgatum]|uniref:Uncharacterized protein n=1 Tax=Panicum virgatum TaxID=38727 RepID=A0A8T0X2Y4_PANVG|nr:hypothetical protein PVAP13_1NG146919 [Panicum virgatum]
MRVRASTTHPRRTRGLFQIPSAAMGRILRPAQWRSLLGRRIETAGHEPLSSPAAVVRSSVVSSPLPPKSKPYAAGRRRPPPPTRHLPCRLRFLSHEGERRGFHGLALRGIQWRRRFWG